MKTFLIVGVSAMLGMWAGWGAATDRAEKNLAQYIQTPDGIEGCRQIVRSAGG